MKNRTGRFSESGVILFLVLLSAAAPSLSKDTLGFRPRLSDGLLSSANDDGLIHNSSLSAGLENFRFFEPLGIPRENDSFLSIGLREGIQRDLQSAAATKQPIWKGRIDREDGVFVVRNPKTPIYRDPILTISLDWTIGGEEKSADEPLLANPMSLALDKKGNLYVLDFKNVAVKVFDPAGRFVRKFGRKGQGPGEFNTAFAINLAPNGDELMVQELKRLSFFNLDGLFLRWHPTKNIVTGAKIDSSGHLYLWEHLRTATEFATRLIVMNSEKSSVADEIVRLDFKRTERTRFDPECFWIVDDSNRLVFGNAASYEIRDYGSDAKLKRRILRDFDPFPVTKKMIDDDRKLSRPPGLSPPTRYPSHLPAFRGFFPDDQGHVFVLTWEHTHDGRQDIYDVFDVEGRYLGRVGLGAFYDRILRGGKLYSIEPEAGGDKVVKRYTVEWKIGEGEISER